MSLIDQFISRVSKRPPDFQIGGSENPYCNRWWVIPRNRWFNIYLHEFVRDDDDRALHDHPWINCSILLRGLYREVMFVNRPVTELRLPATYEIERMPGRPVFRFGATPHRVTLHRSWGQPIRCWSLFITGPVIRSWGFWCPAGRWVHWRDFTSGPRGEIVGRGCE